MSHLLYIKGFISSAHEREKERGTSRQSFIPFSLSLFACVCIHVSLCYMSVYLLPMSEKTEDKTWLPRSVNDPELGPYLNTLVNFMNSAQYMNRFKHCLQHQIHQLPNNASPLQCLPALNVCAHIVAFPSNTMGIVRVALCSAQWGASKHLHTTHCSICSITKQLGKHAKSRTASQFHLAKLYWPNQRIDQYIW